jgi:hypothetical protein
MRKLLSILLAGCATLIAPDRGRCQAPEHESLPVTGWPPPMIAEPASKDRTPEAPEEIADRVPMLRWETPPIPRWQFEAPRDPPQWILTFHETVGAFSRQEQAGVLWRDPGAHQFSTSVGSRWDVVHATQALEEVNVAARTPLPEPFREWYLKSETRADFTGCGQTALSLGTPHNADNGSRFTWSIGVTQREVRKRSRQLIGSTVLNWAGQWQWNERLGIGVRVNYYLDVHHIDALLSLEAKSRAPSP